MAVAAAHALIAHIRLPALRLYCQHIAHAAVGGLLHRQLQPNFVAVGGVDIQLKPLAALQIGIIWQHHGSLFPRLFLFRHVGAVFAQFGRSGGGKRQYAGCKP